jgi:arylsulfatase A-like enzyme
MIRAMPFVRGGRKLVVECVIAGGVVGAIEAVLAAAAATSCRVDSCAIVAALAALGATLGAVVLNVAIRAIRIGPIARWESDLRAGGQRRMLAAWHVAMAVAAVLLFAAAMFIVAARVPSMFRSAAGATLAVILTCLVTPLAVAVAVAAHFVHRRLSPRIAKLTGGLDGKRAWIAGTICVVALTALPILVVHREIPNMNIEPVVSMALTLGVVLAALLVDVSRYRAARIAACALPVALVVGAAMIGRAEQARLIAVEHGSYSKFVAKAIWRLADRDGDGYAAAWAGGADCDDDDPGRSPGRLDIIGNGIDENCTGADAVAPPAGALDARDPSPHTVPNLILISVDALRPDHLGAWGYARPTSPALDRLATGSTRFAWAMTSSPATKHALPSLLTGRHASANHTGALAPTIAEVLRDAGWDTRAVMCCQRIRSPRDLRGFMSVDTSADEVRLRRPGQDNADEVADSTIEWLSHAKSRPNAPPFLLWVHFYDPHDPYEVPPGGLDFGGSEIDRYDAEIAFVDRGIGRVLDSVETLGLGSTTVVVVASDHGDEFDEHGIRFHARSLYNQVVRIPLIIRAPDCHPRVIEEPVSLVDIAPTLLAFAGVAAPSGVHGHSLVPMVCGDAVPTRPVLLELVPERLKRNAVAMVTDRWKVIWDREANAWMLFARSDPEDRNDLSASDPTTLATMKLRLRELIDRELAIPATAKAVGSTTAARVVGP